MTRTAIRLNTVLIERRTERVFVVCHILWESNEAALIEQQVRRAGSKGYHYHRRPVPIRIDQLQRQIETDHYRISNQPLNPDLLYNTALPEASAKRRDENWELVQTIADSPLLLRLYIFGDGLGKQIHELCDFYQVSLKHFYATLHRCLSRGGGRHACTPDYGKPRESTLPASIRSPGPKRGRPPLYAALNFRNWTQEDSINLRLFIRRYKNLSNKSVTALYFDFCLQVLHVIVEKSGRDRVIAITNAPLGLVSLTEFSYHYRIEIPHLWELRRRRGSIHFENNCRAVTSSSRFWIRGPTVRYEIDATVLSVYLRLPVDGQVISIGRPTLYLVVDTFSTMIVGMYLTFLEAEWTAVGEALFNAFTDKVAFCRQFGVEITEEDWPCHAPCDKLRHDRGTDYPRSPIEELLKSEVGVQMAETTAAYMGSQKGCVENALGIIEAEIKQLPGAVDKHRKERPHASNRTQYTYYQLMQDLIELIIEHNNTKSKVELLDAEMRSVSVEATRRAVWNYGMDKLVDPKPKIPDETLRLALLPEAQASLTLEGVLYQGRLYENAACLDYFSMARATHREPITIRHTRTTVDCIFWRDPLGQFHTLQLTYNSRRFRGNCHHDAEIYSHIERIDAAQRDADLFASKLRRHQQRHARDKANRESIRGAEPNHRRSPQPDIRRHKQEAAQKQRDALRDGLLNSMGVTIEDIAPDVAQAFEEDSLDLMQTLFDQMYPDADFVDDDDDSAPGTDEDDPS